MLLPEASSAQCAAVARQGAYSEKRPGRPSQRAVLFGGPAFSAVPCCFFQSGGHATVPARGQKDIQNISNQLYFNYRYGTINPTHNLPLLPMRTYRYCQKGRNGYLRICRCVCSFLISKLANLLGGYSYVASFTHSVANCFLGVTCCNMGFCWHGAMRPRYRKPQTKDSPSITREESNDYSHQPRKRRQYW